MSRVQFFSNTLINLDHTECAIEYSLANTRTSPQRIFTVPEHSVNTSNLLIFIDGKMAIKGRDYEDINSYQVELTSDLPINVDFYSILIFTGTNYIGTGEGEHLIWGDF